MNLIHKVIALAVTILAVSKSTHSQTTNNSEPISIYLSIIGKGIPEICSDSSAHYFVSLRVLNMQDTSVRFWIYSCSWFVDNWVISNNGGSLDNCGCDSNIPVEIILTPKKSIEFYSTLKYKKIDGENVRIKAGFKYFTRALDIVNFAGKQEREKVKIFWSNEIRMWDNLYNYEVK